MEENNFEKTMEQAAAFQRIWTESITKTMQAAFTVTPNSPPPEVLRQIRKGIFQALAESWEEFMRSPQFLEGMRQWMENAVSFRKMSNEFLAHVRNDLQAPSREDMDSIMLTVRHMEKRLLDRMEAFETRLDRILESLERQAQPKGRTQAASEARKTGGEKAAKAKEKAPSKAPVKRRRG